MPTLAPDPVELLLTIPDPIVYAAPVGSDSDTGTITLGVYTRTGALIYDLTGEADLVNISEQLNEWATATIRVPRANTAALAAIEPWTTELHVYRNGVLEFAGPFDNGWRRSGSDGVRTISASDPSRYFAKRTRILPNSEGENLLQNGNFADDWRAWSHTTGATLDSGLFEDVQSVELVNGGSISQLYACTDFLKGSPYQVRLSLRVWIDSAAVSGPIATVRDISTVGRESSATVYVTDSDPREAWTTVTVDLWGPAETPNVTLLTVEALWADDAPVNVDTVTMSVIGWSDLLDALYGIKQEATTPDPVDLVKLARSLVRRNSDLNINFSTGTFSMFIDDQTSPRLAWEWLSQLTDYGTIDIGMVMSRHVRTFTVWPSGRGVDRSETVTLTPNDTDTERPRNCVDYDWSGQPGSGRNDLAVTGSDGLVGRWTELSRFDGFRLQDVRGAPSGYTDVSQLNEYAKGELRRDPEFPSLTLKGVRGGLWDTVRLGDRVTVWIDDYDVQIDSVWRVMERAYDGTTGLWDATLEADPA